MAAELSQVAQEKQLEAQQFQATQQQPSTQLWAAYSPQAGQVTGTVHGTAPVQYVAVSLFLYEMVLTLTGSM